MQQKIEKLPIVNVQACGIDVGSKFHMVAIGQAPEDVKKFGVYTRDLYQLCEWLKEKKIKTIAMESTGSYWKNLFDLLQEHGFEVLLVNGKHTKNLRGRKTDVEDCQWIQKLHSLGLLSASYLPDHFTEQLRTYYRHRQYLLEQASAYIQKMQKSLRLMNVRLDIAINDITGESGQRMIRAILEGERDAEKLAGLGRRLRKSKEEIVKSLQGHWREDYLFELKDCFEMYQTYQEKIVQCDKQIEGYLIKGLEDKDVNGLGTPSLKPNKRINKNAPKMDLNTLSYYHNNGIDLLTIPGVSYSTVLSFIAEMGGNLNKFPTAKHFVSYLRLNPNRRVSGGKVLSSRTPKGGNLLSSALRRAANVIGSNLKEGHLHTFFKRISYRKGHIAAIVATARKLAVIIYKMIINKEQYNPPSHQQYLEHYRQKQIKFLQRKIKSLEVKPFEINFITT